MSTADYEEFCLRTYAKVLSAVILASGHRDDSADAVQEAYVKALSRWDEIGGYEAPEAWVTKVAIRQVWRSRRPRRREARVPLEVTVPPMSTPEQTAEAREVLAALTTLPANMRMALVLCCVLGWPQQEVADMCGVPRATVANRILRGRASLLQMLGMARPASGTREPLVPAPRPVPLSLGIPDEDPLAAALIRTRRWLCAGIEAEPETASRARDLAGSPSAGDSGHGNPSAAEPDAAEPDAAEPARRSRGALARLLRRPPR
jgi:RNA polymerase sigma factor (sigma-70 family)